MQPLEPELLRQYTRREIATPLRQWLAWQLSVWHEIATWYGWSHVSAFPEIASAFSPEDFYSNLLGIWLMGALVHERAAISEDSYNDDPQKELTTRPIVLTGDVLAGISVEHYRITRSKARPSLRS